MTRFRGLLIRLLFPTVVSAWSRTTSTTSFLSSSRAASTVLNMSGGHDSKLQRIRILGVCGGIGSGKSMACNLLVSDLGCISHIGRYIYTVYKNGWIIRFVNWLDESICSIIYRTNINAWSYRFIAFLPEADSVAHTVYKPGSQAIHDVVDKFGSDILLHDKPKGEEEIDRKKLGAIVFSDPSAMSVRLCWLSSVRLLSVCMWEVGRELSMQRIL